MKSLFRDKDGVLLIALSGHPANPDGSPMEKVGDIVDEPIKVVAFIEGGCLVEAISNFDVDFAVVDYDDDEGKSEEEHQKGIVFDDDMDVKQFMDLPSTKGVY